MRTTFFSSLLVALLSLTSHSALAAPTANPQAESSSMQSVEGKVSLNSADAQTLQRVLAGVGKAKAEAIVAHRDAHGAFASIDELLEVKGIGKALLDKNRDKLALN
ncbi:ComEA family DNA-binding protein [Pseudomonas sp. nanlin1]|uniref:ComEA family DNA-binding protein n=1 Tax=Pseudomonas sp. nanlin1 TaxID=3040605 RepID=UPI00388F3DF6